MLWYSFDYIVSIVTVFIYKRLTYTRVALYAYVYDTHQWVCMYASMYRILDTDYILDSEIYFLKYLLSHTICRIFFLLFYDISF